MKHPLANKRDAPELLSIIVGSRSCLSPVIANVSLPLNELMKAEIMACIIRALKDTDEPFLWEMLYQALYLPEGQAALSREIVHLPELARYVQGWGHESDCGFMVIDSLTEQAAGAI